MGDSLSIKGYKRQLETIKGYMTKEFHLGGPGYII